MRKNLFVMAALVLGTFMSVTLTSCGDDEEPTPQQQQEQGNGDDNGNNGENGDDDNGGQSGDEGGENGGGDNGGGENVRPDEDLSGEIGGRKYVDLGLPSATLWATCNVGANSPEEYGLYFAWGETTGYTGNADLDWDTYKWCNGSETTLTKYCPRGGFGDNGFSDNLKELTTSDDAAYVNWGSNWRMPTLVQIQELINSNYTTYEYATENEVKGIKITSKSNGNSIFLPTAGWLGDGLREVQFYGYYWSRTVLASGPSIARYMEFFASTYGTNISVAGDNGYRYNGLSVRPVRNQ